MAEHPTSWRSRPRLLGLGVLVAGILGVLAPASSPAAITSFGSRLSAPATLDTAENLSYLGTYTSVPIAPDAPHGVFHTHHFGADTAIWNVKLANGNPRSPAAGQALQVSLEGCAKAAVGGPAPLTQIHFQDISSLAGGGAKVNLTSQAFVIPVCGEHGAGAGTVTTYTPINLCVGKGDYVAFNDEGGYVENVYRSGVPYRVLGRAHGSTSDSFVRNNGTGNGAILSPSVSAANEGFVANRGEELMLRVKLGTGPNATRLCPGGTGKR